MVKNLAFRKLTLANWLDFEQLFGSKGACGGCWCQWWKVKRSDWDQHKGEKNRQLMRSYVETGNVPGIIGYLGREPVAWCAVEPKNNYPVLQRSRILKNVDDQPAWSVTCFFIKASARGQGISVAILEEAINYVREQGGGLLEGYPIVVRANKLPAPFAWTGLASAFEKAGFIAVDKPSRSKVIMRYKIK